MLKIYIVSIIILVGFTCSEVISQTYATPELEKQAQENAASKKQVDSKSNTLAGVFLEVKNTTPLSETYLAKFFSISVYEITNFSPSNKSSFSEIQK